MTLIPTAANALANLSRSSAAAARVAPNTPSFVDVESNYYFKLACIALRNTTKLNDLSKNAA